jgi:hypothetical protein
LLTAGFLAFTVGLVPVAILFALGRRWTLEAAFIRVSWVPAAALALQGILWRPMTEALGYAFVIPPILTCFVSVFFTVIGVTLLTAGSQAGRRPYLLRATLLASPPGLLLVICLAIGLVRTLVNG